MDCKFKYISYLFLISTCSSTSHRHGYGPVRPSRISGKEKPTNFQPNIPEHCQNLTICDDVLNYPQEYINQLIRDNFTMSNATSLLLSGFEDGKCVQRDHGPNDIDVCTSKVKPIQAKAGKDAKGQWHFLVGESWLCIELCLDAGAQCSKEVYVYTGYKTICLQKFITKRTAAVDNHGNPIIIDLRIPSSCCCHISMTSVRCQQPYLEYEHTETNHDRLEDRAAQRMSERSLPMDGRENLQAVERRLHQDRGNANSGHVSRRRVTGPTMSPDVVVFPGPVRRQSAPDFVPNVPEECMRTGICEDLPDYPEDRVAAIIEGLGNTTDKYKVDELDTPEIAQRIGPPEEMELCEFSLKVVIPKAAPDKDGNWHYILNQKDKPLQGFHVEICKEDRSPCAKMAYFYSGYEASCKQKFMLRYMAGLNSNGEMVEKPFKLPSCCSCVVRQSD